MPVGTSVSPNTIPLKITLMIRDWKVNCATSDDSFRN